MAEPWWTEADQAELDAAIWAVVVAADEAPACTPVVVSLLVDWLEMRRMVSRAEWHRRQHLRESLAEIEEWVA